MKQVIKQEIEILLTVKHQYIVNLQEAFEDHAYVHLVFEHISGGSLLDLMRKSKDGHFEEKEAKRVFLQIIDCLQYLHSNHIIHRDIKPENILISEDNNMNIKLIDFGFSVRVDNNELLSEQLGSVDYISPEIAMGNSYDSKIDVWAAGVILFNMITGMQAFAGDREELVIQKIISEEPKYELISRHLHN
jgi:serine/threonine protein kinase